MYNLPADAAAQKAQKKKKRQNRKTNKQKKTLGMASPYASPDLLELGRRLLAEGPLRTLATEKRVRIQFGGAVVADTTEALYVWEKVSTLR